MTGSAPGADRAPEGLAGLLIDASTEAVRTADGHVAGVYLRSGGAGLLRLAVLAGLPGPLFKPWWRLHVDRPFPVADAFRLGTEVVLPNATEAMRRYPQFAAGLPFPFGSLYVPVVGGDRTFGVLTVLRPSAADATEIGTARERVADLAGRLGARLLRLARADPAAVTWDDEPLCVPPPVTRAAAGRSGGFGWDPVTDTVTADARLAALLGTPAARLSGPVAALADAVAPGDTARMLAALRDTAAGRPPPLPLYVRAGDGTLRLLELRTTGTAPPAPGPRPVFGLVVEPGTGAAGDAAADLLPEGVLCLDRLGLVRYANPRAGELLRRASAELLGRPLWEAVPWLGGPAGEDHMRAALLSPDPIRFHAGLPGGSGAHAGAPDGSRDGPAAADELWLDVAIHPGPTVLTCTFRPAHRLPEPSDEEAGGDVPEAPSVAPLYRPIALAIALSEAVTARQVSAVVMRELLPAFGGRRLAIYLLQDRRLYLAWENGFPAGFLDPFEGVGLDAELPGVRTLTTGRPLFFDSMERLTAAYPGIALDAERGSRAFLPLIASGRPVGSCILGFDLPRRFSTQERAALTALAGLIAHALEKAQRYESEAALARGLQHALLPRRLSAHPRVETTGRYLPGTQGMEIGGDWYDVVESGDGLALVIGDVQGHGVQAAATMGQLRTAVRAFALGDRPPDEVLAGTNHLLIDLDPGLFASCCYLRLDPASGVARAARAGHLPPLLRRPDGRTEVVDLPGGVVLGVDPRARYPVTEVRLDPGAVLALYTDGLVERPGADIDDGIEGLRAALAEARPPAAGPPLPALADLLTETARRTTDRPDDIALLLASRPGAGSGPRPSRPATGPHPP
ncbi:SpoIIE family protein phosphatase [Streptomyces sp. NPDC101249]|uniref:SpoIIE family protein phosphatase n=1 Tax=Streptomyces sp. NPDC101249 TaxID=3366140 RepID=UPI00380DBD1D